MPIRDDDDLAAVALDIGQKLHEIQTYLGNTSSSLAKIRFPRGFIRTADHFRSRLPFIEDRHHRDNLAYSLILTDVYYWLVSRTDLYGTAREMVLKAGIVLAGSICETMAVSYTAGAIGRSVRFKRRCDRMLAAEIISEPVRDDLHWLWDTRAAVHLCDVQIREYDRYNLADYDRANTCMRSLRDELDAHAAAQAAF